MDEEEKAAKKKQIELLEQLQSSNYELNDKLIKQKKEFDRNLGNVQRQLEQRLKEMTSLSDTLKKREVTHRIANELKNILVVQQKMALKRQLARLDVQYNSLKEELDKEVNNIF